MLEFNVSLLVVLEPKSTFAKPSYNLCIYKEACRPYTLLIENVVEQHVSPLRLHSHEVVHTSLGSFDSCLVNVNDACMNSLDDDSIIVSMPLDVTSPKHDDCDLNDIGTFTYSLSSYNPLEKGCLFNFVDKARLEGVLDLMMAAGFQLKEDLHFYTSYTILDWRSRLRSMHEESALQVEYSNKVMLETTLEATNSIWRPNGDPWFGALKGQNFVMFKVPKLITIFHNSVLPNHVHLDYHCFSLSLSWHSYNPLQKGSLFYVVGSFRMHKDYWEKKKAMVEIVETPKLKKANLDLLKAEKHLKRSLELDASQEELVFFNGKLTRAEIKKLMVRLKVLQRNIELKGKDLGNEMSEPTLLDVLKKKVQNLLIRLQVHGRARRPKERIKGHFPLRYDTLALIKRPNCSPFPIGLNGENFVTFKEPTLIYNKHDSFSSKHVHLIAHNVVHKHVPLASHFASICISSLHTYNPL